MNKNLKSTLRVPFTEFPLRNSLFELDKSIFDYWQAINLYNCLQERNGPSFDLHMGPPFTNGGLHMGHGLSFGLKSIIASIYSILGYKVNCVLGWDCHGLPIETKIKTLGELSKKEFYEKCREFSSHWIEVQKPDAHRLCHIHSDDYYSTMKSLPDIYNAFSKLLLQGDVLVKNKPIIWSVKYKCNIPDIDVEYANKTSNAIYQYCQVSNEDFGLLIFTTTPWSTFDNMFICLNENFMYSLIEYNGRKFYVATDTIEALNKKIFNDHYSVISEISGRNLINKNLKYLHLIFGYECEILHGDHVTKEGTGLVHTAPAHGHEDYDVVYNIYKKTPHISDLVSVDGFIEYKEKIHIIDDINKILEILLPNTVFTEQIVHSYPFYKGYPLIYKTSEQIYFNIDRVRKDLIDQLNNIITAPKSMLENFKNAVNNREEWCISRNRTYGVPLCLFIHKKNRTLLIDKEVQLIICEQIKKDCTYFLTADCVNILPSKYRDDYQPYLGVLDCWVDSACVSGVIVPTFGVNEVADVYVEGKDQMRGWFNSSAFFAMMLNGKLPYKAIVSHGFVVDSKTREKLSKSKENSKVTLMDFMNTIGLDVFLILIADSNFKDDVVINDSEQSKIKYMKFRGVLRYLCSVMESEKVTEIHRFTSTMERVFMYKLHKVIKEYITLAKSYEIHFMFNLINNFVVEFSAIYLNACKDCLYADSDSSVRRKEIVSLLNIAFKAMLMMLAPFIPRTCEEVFLHIKQLFNCSSVFLLNLTELFESLNIDEYEEDLKKYEEVMSNIIPVINVELESLKQNKVISKNLNVNIILNTTDKTILDIVFDVTNCNSVFSGEKLEIKVLSENKCERCSKSCGDSNVCKRCEKFLSE